MNITLSQSGLSKAQDIYEQAIAGAVEYVGNILRATDLDVPEDLVERLRDATDKGTMLVREDGAFSFPQTNEEGEVMPSKEEVSEGDDIDQAEKILEEEKEKK